MGIERGQEGEEEQGVYVTVYSFGRSTINSLSRSTGMDHSSGLEGPPPHEGGCTVMRPIPSCLCCYALKFAGFLLCDSEMP